MKVFTNINKRNILTQMIKKILFLLFYNIINKRSQDKK